jgi:probable O-glycosylation ligase (exosortase A-associated)
LLRLGILGAMILTAIAAIGTQSRGALLGMAAMGVMLWLRGRQKLMLALVAGASVFAITHIMPQKWYDRIATITNYGEDRSVIERFEAWRYAFHLAQERFLGGGFETFYDETDAHSIYFEVLGEHGFVGLGLFLALGLMTYLSCWQIRRQAQRRKETMWLADLCRMLQVSLVAYAVAGAFLGMAYFDYFYNLVLLVVMGRVVLAKELAALAGSASDATVPPTAPSSGHPLPAHQTAHPTPSGQFHRRDDAAKAPVE